MLEKLDISQKIGVLSSVIHVLFITNLLTSVMISPFLFHLWFVSVESQTVITYFISLLTVTPALTAAVYTIWKHIVGSDNSVFKNYIKAYKNNFKQSFVIGAAQLVLASIFLYDFLYIQSRPEISKLWLIPVVIFLFFITSSYIYQLILIARFDTKSGQLLKNSLVVSIKNYKQTFINMLILLVIYIMLNAIPNSLKVLLLMSVTIYIVLLNMKPTILDLEKFSEKNQIGEC